MFNQLTGCGMLVESIDRLGSTCQPITNWLRCISQLFGFSNISLKLVSETVDRLGIMGIEKEEDHIYKSIVTS